MELCASCLVIEHILLFAGSLDWARAQEAPQQMVSVCPTVLWYSRPIVTLSESLTQVQVTNVCQAVLCDIIEVQSCSGCQMRQLRYQLTGMSR